MLSYEEVKKTAKTNEGLEFTQADLKYACECKSDGEAKTLLNKLIKDNLVRFKGKTGFNGCKIYVVTSPEIIIDDSIAKVLALIVVKHWDTETAIRCIHDTIHDIVTLDVFIVMVQKRLLKN